MTTSAIRAVVEVSQEPKSGAGDGACDDAAWPRRDEQLDFPECVRVAVADGATESYLAGRWATRLVETFQATGCASRELLYSASAAWEQVDLPGFLRQREEQARPIQWFEEPLIARGAFATLLGLELHASSRREVSGRWRATALGDSCLFQVRGGVLLEQFPRIAASEFGSLPLLVPSDRTKLEHVLAMVQEFEGRWQRGDVFLLTTDALAAWIMKMHEQGTSPWNLLCEIDRPPAPDFHEWVADQRANRSMVDDDVTLMRVFPQ